MTSAEWVEHAYPLQQVVVRLPGDVKGSSHDDDFGYSFTVVDASPGPSFFDSPAGQE